MHVFKQFMGAASAALCVLLTACATSPLTSQESAPTVSVATSPEAVIEAQLAAYNRRDVEGFLSYYSDDAKIYNHPDKLTESGKDQLRSRYKFKNPDVRASIVKRMVFGRFVIDHERITGRPEGIFEAIAVYEVKDGKIVTVTFLEP